MTYNKYDIVNTTALIKWVQQSHLAVEKARADKKTSSTKMIRLNRELANMRGDLFARLTKMDRMDPTFFPVQAMVEYKHPYYPNLVKYGVVVAHEDDKVLCQFDGEDYQVKVEPAHLTLRFIRHKFY